MSGKHQGLRYFQKFLNSKASERNALAKKVLRYVMAVGFALSPWLGGEAYAAGIERVDDLNLPSNSEVKQTYFNGSDSNVAHIYAEKASGDVGLNRFKTFNVADGQIANMHFKTSPTGATLNYLVNTVEGEINISGTVNAIRNNKIGGKLYFLSPQGMVVGAGGVINAGSLTVLANNQTFQRAEDAYEVVHDREGDEWYRPEVQSSIEIYGQINTATGINLEAQTIQIAKVSGSNTAPSLLTGVVFHKLVNIDSYGALPIANNRMTAYRDEKTNTIIVADPSNSGNATGDELLQGDGRIRVYARRDIAGEGLHGTATFTEGVINAIGDVAIECGSTIEIDKPTSGTTPSSTVNKTSITSGNQIKLLAETGDIYNAGTIVGANTIDASAGYDRSQSNDANIINYGTIQSTNGGMSLAMDRSLTNTGAILAKEQIVFTVGGNLTNEGKIESTSSNVQAHIGRNFKNLGDADSKSLQKGFIQAGGNVQVDYNLDTEHTYIGVASSEEPIDGIYNSGLIWAKGDKDPVKKPDGTVDANSGSGNIWLTSAYNIENTATGQMIAGRQITLNARDFLHNYGLIQGVTYLDIKSIMGYVYNHASGVIRATGGNIDLSTGQANLQIDTDLDGEKKELYRKFTPIIIEGSVEATSALNNTTSETNQGNINIRAYLGDIYIVEGTIRANAKQVTSGEKESAAGDVILDAAQNITIGFETVKAWADDPTTDNKDGYHPEYVSDTERGYYKPISDSNSVPSSPCQKPATISGSDITLKSGSDENYNIFMSNTTTVSNTLTASNAINIDTASMNIIGGTLNASTLNATGELTLTGGTVTSDGDLTISGAKGLTIGSDAGISTGGNLTFASSEGAVINDHTWDNQNGSVTLSGKTGVTNNATITSSNGIGMTSAEGTIVNNAELTAKGGAVSFKGKGDITNNAPIEANGSVNIISTGGKVTNRAGIIAGKNFATPAASLFSLRARARAVGNGSVKISGRDGVINNNAEASISAAGGVSITSEAGAVQNSSAVNTSGSVEISGSSVSNSGALTTTSGSVEISGSSGIKNTGNITATDNVSMTASAGSIINTGTTEIKSTGGSVEISGSSGIENTGNITAAENVTMTASAGSIINTGTTEIKSTGGSVEISGSSGIENTANIEASKNVTMTASAGSIKNSPDSTVASTSGSVSMNAGGDVTGGTITGKDVTLTGGSGSNVTAASITVDNSLQLQGDNITAVVRGNDASGALNVGVSGAGGSNSTAQGDVNLKINSDVVFSNVNVSNANVETSGTIEVEKLHVEGKAGFVSSDTTVNIYGQGVTPGPNDTTAIQDKGDGNSSWLTLKIDDTGVQSIFVGEEAKAPNNIQDSAVQMSGKLVDYDSYDTYLEHYGDVADLFGRSDLIQASERPTGETATREEDNKVVLKQDADGLRLEEQKQE